MKLKLSPKNIANLELAPDQDEQFYWDTDLSGYALRLRKGGHRTFVTQYRHHGRTRRMIIGDAKKVTEAAARKAAQKVLAKVELGGDPQGDKQEARQAAVHTLRSVAEDYLAAKAPGLRPTSLRLSRLYLIGAYFKPLHTTAITAITHRDVASRITAIKRTSGEVHGPAGTCSSVSVFPVGNGRRVDVEQSGGQHQFAGRVAGARPRAGWQRACHDLARARWRAR